MKKTHNSNAFFKVIVSAQNKAVRRCAPGAARLSLSAKSFFRQYCARRPNVVQSLRFARDDRLWF